MVFDKKLTEKEMKILKLMEKFVKNAHADSGSHDYSHILCVCRNAIQIGKEVEDSVDPFILSAGALMHDIGKTNKVFAHIHGLFGGSIAEEFLDGLKVDKIKSEAITRIVVRHTPRSMILPETVEEKIVQDADSLDQLGLIGILRGVIGEKGSMEEILRKYIENKLRVFARFHYDYSRKIAESKQDETYRFIKIINERFTARMASIGNIFKDSGLIVNK